LTSDGLLPSDVGTTIVLSADGTRMVFVSRAADGRTHLNVRALDRPNTIRLPGTEGARGPFVSPDGRWIGFWADGKLKKIAADGGAPVGSATPGDLLGATWGEDDTIEVYPSISPDGRWITYASNESAAVGDFRTPFSG
jgi:hypothetical protein